jgi:hypothetical protein
MTKVIVLTKWRNKAWKIHARLFTKFPENCATSCDIFTEKSFVGKFGMFIENYTTRIEELETGVSI